MDTQLDFEFEEKKFLDAQIAFDEVNDKYNKLLTFFSADSIKKLEVIYLYKKIVTVRDMTPKGFGTIEEEIRKDKLEKLNVLLMNKISNYFGGDVGVNFVSFVENLIESEKMDLSSSYNLVNNYKRELTEVCKNYLGDVKVILPIQNISKIHCAKYRENQYYNEIVDAIFATSSYDDILKYIMRANAGGMIVRGDRIDLPKNPFDIERIEDDKVYLKDFVSIYSLDASEFEPVVDFFVDNGVPNLVFDYEWISRCESLEVFETRVDFLPSSFFESNRVFTYDSDLPICINDRIRKVNVK